ncbi:MAG: hypothetical protein JWQ63_148 [Mucilaginibacter sp.]|nr:hypothetical protein [Mucilaginibacter sp.]
MAGFSIGKQNIAVLGTVLAVIFLGACYFFLYIPNNEKTVQERRFRCLQNIDGNFHSKIESSFFQVNSLFKTYPKYSLTLKTYIDKYPKTNFALIPVRKLSKKESQIFKTGIDSLSSIAVDFNSRQIILSVNKYLKIKNRKTDLPYRMEIRYGFEQFIKPLLLAGVFDNYIVFYSDKTDSKIVYQSFPSGLSFQKRDSLLGVKNGVVGPGVRSLKVGGTDYKVFSQPVNIDDHSEWIISGFVLNKNYQKEKNQLPLSIVLFLLTAVITMIVSFPWLKLYQMGNKDKLTITDGVSTILVSMALMSLLFFVLFKYALDSKPDISYQSGNFLAKSISSAFTKELNTAYSKLDSFNNLYAEIKTYDIINLGKSKAKVIKGDFHDSTDIDEINKLTGLSVNRVFWADATGMEKNAWTTDSINAPHLNLKSRQYFNAIINNKTYGFKNKEFYLEQLTSRITGIFSSVISMPTKVNNTSVAAMSFNMTSVKNVVMPDGYMFAIINSSGNVLYHYRAERNLNENLKDEFADSTELVSALQAKSDTFFKAEYFGKPYIIKIRPMDIVPYFIVVFEDNSYSETRDTEVYIFTFAMLFFLLVLLVLQFITIFLASSKRSFFKNQLFETSWIGPKVDLHRQYNQAIISNAAIIFLLIVFFKCSSFLEYLYILLFSITFISIILNSIFAIHYKKHNHYNYRFKIIALRWLILFVGVIDYVAWRTLDHGSSKTSEHGIFKIFDHNHFFVLLLFELLSLALCILICKFSSYLLEKARNLKYKYSINWTFSQSFALMATTGLVITSGLPVMLFYTYSYDYEQNVNTRYKQMVFGAALAQKIPKKSITAKTLDGIKKGLLYTEGIYYDGTFIDSVNINTDTIKNRSSNYSKEDMLTISLLSAFRFYKSGNAVKSNNLNLNQAGQGISFNHLLQDKCDKSKGAITYKQIYRNDDVTNMMITSSPNLNYKLKSSQFLLFLIIAIFIFYYALNKIIRKLFALNLPSTDDWKKIDEQLLLDTNLNKLVFIVGAPGSGKLSKLKEKINQKKLLDDNGGPLILNEEDPSKYNVFIADMILISPEAGEADPTWKECREKALESETMVIINHFEYNIRNVNTNIIKLNFLEALLQKGKCKVFIISTVHPVTFLNSFSSGVDSSNELANKTLQENDLERWHVLLGHFRILIQSLEGSRIPPHVSIMERIIMEETQYTHFLHKMQGLSLKIQPSLDNSDFDAIGTTTDSLIFKLQLTSQYFYTYIWQSLTQEEKFLLYDLAEDGLVNSYDNYNLSMLISKGLIIRFNGTLMLFNRGFRNFILTSIGNAEVNRIKNLVKDTGNWGNLKTPLILAILAILVFLIASQQEAYSSIITYITALGAGISGILKIFSMVGNNNNSQKA